MTHLVAAVILGRLDYCNSVLAGSAMVNNAPLQRVQNAAAQLVLGLSPRDHVSPAFAKLHWLPIYYRIQFKLALLMYMAHVSQSPAYIIAPLRQSVKSRHTIVYALLLLPLLTLSYKEQEQSSGESIQLLQTYYMEFSPQVSENSQLCRNF